MKESQIAILTYGSMIGAPVLLALLALLNLSGLGTLYGIYTGLRILLAVDLLLFGAIGMREIYLGKRVNPIKLGIKTAEEQPIRNGEADTLRFRVYRFKEESKRLEESVYDVAVGKYTSVLGALVKIKAEKDPTISMRYSCNMGICGSCGMTVNGKPSLACETNALKSARNGIITIGPMLGHPLLKDLVTDFDDFFGKHESISPHLEREDRKEKYEAPKEYAQTREQIGRFLPYSYCIMCGLCMDACPVVNTSPAFLGPQALSQAYRYYMDSRDQMGERRLQMVNTKDGVWDCEYAGTCSEVCPKGVDPATAIQSMKFEMLVPKFVMKKEGAEMEK